MPLDLPSLNRNLRWLTVYRTLALSYPFAPFYVLFLLHLGATPAQALALTGVTTFTNASTQLLTGYFADRYSRKASLQLGCLLSAAGLVVVASSNHYGPWLTGAAALYGLGTSFTDGPDSALAYDSCVEAAGEAQTRSQRFQDVSSAMGSAAESLTAFAGAAVIGLIAGPALGLRLFMWLQVLVFLAAVPVVSLVQNPSFHQQRLSNLRALGHVLVSLRHRGHLLATFLYAAAIGSITFVMVWLTPAYYAQLRWHSHPLPTSWFGVIWGLYLASVPVFTLLAHRYRRRTGPLGSLTGLLITALAVYPAIAPVWLGGLVLIVALYFVRSVQFPQLADRVNQLSSRHELTTIASMQRLTFRLFYSGLTWLVGWYMTRLPSTHALTGGILLAGAVCGLAGLLALMWLYATHPTPSS